MTDSGKLISVLQEACVIRWTCTFGEKFLSSQTNYMTDSGKLISVLQVFALW